MYAHLDNMTVANGFTYNWFPHKSIGNGSLDADNASANFSFGLEDSSRDKGQSLYYLTAPLYCNAYFKYDELSIDDNDYYKEVVKSYIIEDIRKAFGIETREMCIAGLNELNYINEVDPEEVSGYVVTAQLELQIRWYDERI